MEGSEEDLMRKRAAFNHVPQRSKQMDTRVLDFGSRSTEDALRKHRALIQRGSPKSVDDDPPVRVSETRTEAERRASNFTASGVCWDLLH